VVVEVTADHDRTVRVLTEDVSDDLENSQCPVFLEEVISTLQIYIENLYLDWTGG
jgi:hypothetical protein